MFFKPHIKTEPKNFMNFISKSAMLDGVPKRKYPMLSYRYFKEFLEVLAEKLV